ncbi:MAG: regulatory protein RecX [Cellvibrionaceae bacterium]
MSAFAASSECDFNMSFPMSRDSDKKGNDKKGSDSQKSAMNSALRYLARRDYSRLELYQKLIAKGLQSSVVNETLDNLKLQGYQSDERFAEMFIRSRISSGDGPFKIKIALRGKGICDSLALAVFDKLQVDWFEQVQTVQRKRFGDLPIEDVTETARQVRYLKNKGFYQEHINAVIKHTF